MIEPALSSLLAWWVHGEIPHPIAATGGVLILGTVAGSALLARSAGPRASPA